MARNTVTWIVCRGSERPVVDGHVNCPMPSPAPRTRTVLVEDCLECRHLIATPIERLPEATCSTDASRPWPPAVYDLL